MNDKENTTSGPLGPGVWGHALAFLGHLYPLMSGRGSLANLPFMKSAFPGKSQVAWARVGKARCLVPLDDYVGRAAFIFGDLDRKITWVINRCVQPGDVVLDVGANLGVVTLILAQRVGKKGMVHAFEPSPAVLTYLRETIRRSPALPIQLHEVAVGAQEDEMVLSIPPENAGAASLVKTHMRKGSTSCTVPVKRLSDVLSNVLSGPISFMKIDVEGFEADTLRGLLEGENARQPSVIVLEEHSPQDSAAFFLLKKNHYSIYGLPKSMLRAPRLVASDRTGFVSCHDFVAIHASAESFTRRALGI